MHDYTFRLDRILDREDDPPLICDACNGRGKLIDTWGPMHCWTCDGSGLILRSAWLAYIRTFSPDIRKHLLANMPPVYTNGGNHNHHVR
jgi:hypothetical protein